MSITESPEPIEAITLWRNRQSKPTPAEFDKWNIDTLIDYIINTHHRYAKENAVIIYDLAQDATERHPELKELPAALFLFFDDLLYHLKKEEQLLFPNIRQLANKKRFTEKFVYTTFGFIKELVVEMKKEHLAAGNELKLLRTLTAEYMLRSDASDSCKRLFEKIKEFETDLFQHVDLENIILFPQAIAIDDKGLDEIVKVNS